jgi:hypothetical protein
VETSKEKNMVSNGARYIILIILFVLISSLVIFVVSKKRESENQNAPQNISSMKPQSQTSSKIKATSSNENKILVPISFDFVSKEISNNAIINKETIDSDEISPVISSASLAPTSSGAMSKTVNLDYLFSAYINTAATSHQTNINQFGIGGLDNAGEKYLISTYFTSADRNADAVFTNNGDKVAFQDQDGLYLYIFSTKEKTKIINESIIQNYGGWSSDGNKLAYLQEINGKKQWNIYNTNSKVIQTIPTIFEDDSSNFAWMPTGNDFAYNSQTTFKVYLSINNEVQELSNFTCDSNLIFSQDGHYLTCTNSKWIRMYNVQTGTTIKWDDPNNDWYYKYHSPIWINASYNSADPLLFIYTEDNKLHITSKERFFDASKPETKELLLNTPLKNIMMFPGFGIYNIRYINDNQAISEATIDGDNESLIFIEGFANLTYENPNLTIKFLEKNKGLSTHGFSLGSVSIDIK